MPSQPRTVLVIEDEAAVLYARKRILSDAGVVVIEAATAAHGLAACQTQAPDLVLSDIHLPDGNGYQLCRDVRTALPDVPVILISSRYDHETAESAAIFAGACAFLAEPVPAAVLLDTIKQHVPSATRRR